MKIGKRAVKLADQSIKRIGLIANAVGTLGILMLMLVIDADIVMRSGFESPIAGVPELVRLGIVGIVFLQLPDTVGRGRLTRSDGLINRLLKYKPRKRKALEAIFHVLGAALFAIVCAASIPILVRAFASGDFVGAIGIFTAPTWPMHAIVAAGSALASIQFLLMALSDVGLGSARA